MKRFITAVIVTMLVFGPAHAGGGKIEEALKQTEQNLLDSLLKGDGAPFEQALADTFVFIAPDGTAQQRAAFIADLTNGNLKMASSTNDDMDVRVYGNAEVVSYRSTDKGTNKDKDISGQYRWTDVFVKEGGKWRIVSTQGTPVATP